MPVNIVLADDHPVVYEGVSSVVQGLGMEIVHTVSSSSMMIQSVFEHRPQVLVTEVRLAGHDALYTLESIQQKVPECRVVVFTRFEHPSNIARAIALGVREYVLKSSPTSELADGIQNAAQNNPTREDSLLLTTKTRMKRVTKISPDSPLTNRETQVLRHVSMGLKNREIGKSLGISVETVKEHVQNILRKLNVNDRTQAAVWAIRKDYV